MNRIGVRRKSIGFEVEEAFRVWAALTHRSVIVHRVNFVLPGLLVLLFLVSESRGEEVPLETCDRLPVIHVKISGMDFLFLVDTAATSTINVKSFPHGEPEKLAVSSWTGTARVDGQKVTIGSLGVGRHRFLNITLPSVDLSAIGRVCGRTIDGILGSDLLARLGATLDFHRSVMYLSEPETEQTLVSESHALLQMCERAFNSADESGFADCLDPQVVIFTTTGDFYGRDSAMAYYRSNFFQKKPIPHLQLLPQTDHIVTEGIWIEYDLVLSTGTKVIAARGNALCRKVNGKWHVMQMNHYRDQDLVQP